MFSLLVRAPSSLPPSHATLLSAALSTFLCGNSTPPQAETLALWPFATPAPSTFSRDQLPLLSLDALHGALDSLGAAATESDIVTHPLVATGAVASTTTLLGDVPTTTLTMIACLFADIAVSGLFDDEQDAETGESRVSTAISHASLFRVRIAWQILVMLSDARFSYKKALLESHLSLLLDADASLTVAIASLAARRIPISALWLREFIIASIPRVRAARRLRRLIASQWAVDLYDQLCAKSTFLSPKVSSIQDENDTKSDENIQESHISAHRPQWQLESNTPLSPAALLGMARAFRASHPNPVYEFGKDSPYELFYLFFCALYHVLPDDVPRRPRQPGEDDICATLQDLRTAVRGDIHTHIKEKNGIHLDRSKVKFAIERIDSFIMALIVQPMSGMGQVSIKAFFAGAPAGT